MSQIKTYPEIIPLIEEVATEAAQLLDLPNHYTAESLLQYFQWKQERMNAEYFENPDATLKQAGLTLSATSGGVTQKECPVCLAVLPADDGLALACGHWFCRDCYCGHMTAAMDNGPTSIRTCCPAYKCGQIIPRDMVCGLLSAELYQKYLIYVVRHFIDFGGSRGATHILQYCPNPDCDRVCIGNRSILGYDRICCPCNTEFCLLCGQLWHEPCSCADWKLWKKKETDEEETTKWLEVNTKACPKCHVSIEKNQGCNHMSCKGCKHQFCWLCMSDWANHNGGNFVCNVYNKSDHKQQLEKQEAIKADLARYVHYFERFAAHNKSLEYAKRLPQYGARGLEYMDRARLTIIAAHQMLKYSYVYAYYLTDKVRLTLFEYQQSMLETNTDQLQEILETKIGASAGVEAEYLREKNVNNLNSIIMNFMKSLVGSLHESSGGVGDVSANDTCCGGGDNPHIINYDDYLLDDDTDPELFYESDA